MVGTWNGDIGDVIAFVDSAIGDSIEHYVGCAWVNSFFPQHIKVGSPPQVPKPVFFLVGLGDNEKIAVSIFNYALYTMCNELRHSGDRTDLKLTLKHVMGEIYMKPAARQVWEDFFGFPRGQARRNGRPTSSQ